MRPRVKPEHRPVRYGGDRVRIGGIVPGIASDVRDSDGWVWALLELLDGTRTVDRVVLELVHRFPSHPAHEVREAIGRLIREGYLEDAAETVPEEVSAAEALRYGRGRALWRWMDRGRASSWQAQVLLRRARVVVVGIGGVGCTAALDLAVSGVGTLHCVEPDAVELSNLNRQILFTERDLRRPKVEAAVRRLRAHNSSIRITGERRRIDGPGGLRTLAVACDVLVLAADEPERIRSWANQACWASGTAWVHGGYHGPLVSIGMYRPGTGGPCYDCAYAAERARRTAWPRRTPWAADAGAVEHAANAVTAGIAGHLAAHATMSLITGVPALRANRQFGVNLVTLHDCYVLGPDKSHPDCPTCGRAQSGGQ